MKKNSSKSILLIEDEISEIIYLYEILKFYANLTLYHNPKEVLNNSNLGSYDLIITDIQMPNISGYDFIRIIREKNIYTPIIVTSAYAMRDDVEKAFSIGASDYITKPIKIDKLHDLVFKYLDIDIKNPDDQLSEVLKTINKYSITNYSKRRSLSELIAKKRTSKDDYQSIVENIDRNIEEFRSLKKEFLAIKNNIEDDYKFIYREIYYSFLSTENVIDKYLQDN